VRVNMIFLSCFFFLLEIVYGQRSIMYHVQNYTHKNNEFDIKEITTLQLGGLPISYIIKLN